MASISGDENPIQETGKYSEWKIHFMFISSKKQPFIQLYCTDRYYGKTGKTGDNANVARQLYIDWILRSYSALVRNVPDN